MRPALSSFVGNSKSDVQPMSTLANRCAKCGGRFSLVSHHHWGLRFCRKACKENYLAKAAQDHARMRKWFGFFARATN
jgi:hypothetical protein